MFAAKGGADTQTLAYCEFQYAQLQAAFMRLQEAETEGRGEHTALQHNLEWAQARFKYGEEHVARLWQYNEQGNRVLSSLRMEYANQCNQYAQYVRAVSEANSSQTVETLVERAEGFMAELMG